MEIPGVEHDGKSIRKFKTGNFVGSSCSATFSTTASSDFLSAKSQLRSLSDATTSSPSVEAKKSESGSISSKTRGSIGSTIQDDIRRVEEDFAKLESDINKNGVFSREATLELALSVRSSVHPSH